MSTPDYNGLARKYAGNWRKFSSFAWSRQYDLDNPDNYAIVYTHNRDSDLLEESNASTIEKLLKKFIQKGIILEEHHNHWACGWVDGYAIPVYRKDGKTVTEAFKAYCDIQAQLEDYPVLDEDDYSDREYDSNIENITNALRWGCKFELKDKLPKDYVSKIYNWLFDNDSGALEHPDDSYPSPDSLYRACKALRFLA